MSIKISINELRWRISLAEYSEFCEDLKNRLENLRATPSSFSRCEAWAYLRLPPEEARINYRSRYYELDNSHASREWGEDADADERARKWSAAVLKDTAHFYFLSSDFVTRLKVHGAKRYCKLRESKSHEQAVKLMTGVVGVEIGEVHLRKLAKVQLAPAEIIRKSLLHLSSSFYPLEFRESRHAVLNKGSLRYVGNYDGFDYKLRFVVDDRQSGGLECDLFVSLEGEKTKRFVFGVAKPAWDIITLESLEADLTYLVRKVRVRLDAAFG